MRSPTRMLMNGGRKLLVLILGFVISILYLTFLVYSYKEELRISEEKSAVFKQNQDRLAAQLQVAHEQKSHVKQQLETCEVNFGSKKNELLGMRETATVLEKEVKSVRLDLQNAKQARDSAKGEFEDLSLEHKKLVESSKLMMANCERDNDDHKKLVESMKVSRDEDRVKCSKDIQKLKDDQFLKLASLEEINAKLKKSLTQYQDDKKAKHSRAPKPNNENETRPNGRVGVDVPNPNHNPSPRLQKVPSDSLSPARSRTDVEKPRGSEASKVNGDKHVPLVKPALDSYQVNHEGADVDSLANSPGMSRRGRENDGLQVGRPLSDGQRRDSGFRVVEPPRPVLREPRLNVGPDSDRSLGDGRVGDGGGVLVEPNLESSKKSLRKILPLGAHDHQIAEPLLKDQRSAQVGRKDPRGASIRNQPSKVIQSPLRENRGNPEGLQPQVDNPLEVVPNPNVILPPQLQLNPPEGDILKAKEPEGADDEDEDNALADREFGAGALEKPQADQGFVDQNPEDPEMPAWDARKINRLNEVFRKKRKFA